MKRRTRSLIAACTAAALVALAATALRFAFVSFEPPVGMSWWTWRFPAFFLSICLAATLYILMERRWLAFCLALAAIGLIFGLGINGTHWWLPHGVYWDCKIAWYYIIGTLSRTHPGYAYFVSLAWTSIAGFITAAGAGVGCFAIIERAAQEQRQSQSDKGTNRYRSRETVFGSADWSSWDKIAKTVGDPDGMVFAEDYDPRKSTMDFDIRDPKTWGIGGKAPLVTMRAGFEGGHSLIFAGTGGGKTAGIVFPTMLTCKMPIIVVDPTGEIYDQMRPAREAMGFKARVIEQGKGVNIIKLMRPYFDEGDIAYLHMATSLTAPRIESHSDAGRFFTEEAGMLTCGLLKYLVETNTAEPFQELAILICLSEAALKKNIQKIVVMDGISDGVKKFLSSFIEMDSRTFTSLQSTMKQALKWALLKEWESILDTEPDDQPPLFGPQTDIYIRFSLSDIMSCPSIVREILSVILFIADKDPNPTERLMIVDEAYQVGKLKSFEIIRDTMRKKGLHLMLVFQSTGQLKELYGESGVKSWFNSVAARVYATTEDEKDQEELSKAIGDYTVDIEARSRSKSIRGIFAVTPTTSSSQNMSLQRARLMRPESLRTFPGDGLIVFFKGFAPLICGKAFSFRRKEWQTYTPFKAPK